MDEATENGIFAIDSFAIDPKVDSERIRAEFYEHGRVRVRNFLNHQAADALYHHLDNEVLWRTFVVANEELIGTPVDAGPITADEEREALEMAVVGAKSGYAALYDATRLFSEDVEEAEERSEHAAGSVLALCDAFLASEPFMAFVRKIVGIPEIARVATQAVRLRAGHFAGLRASTWSADKTSKRRASFFLHLTPEWLPERGGLTEFRLRDGDVVEAYMPVFNALDIVAFPQGWWISTVSPFAEAPVYMVHGRLYLE